MAMVTEAEIRAEEREQCAKVAESIGMVHIAPADDYERGFHEAALSIASAIRSAHQ